MNQPDPRKEGGPMDGGPGALLWGLIIIAAAMLIVIFIVGAAMSQTPDAIPTTFVWRANAEDDLAGYIVMYGGAAGAHLAENTVGLDTSAVILWPEYFPLYAVVKAYDAAGNVSEPSVEAVKLPYIQSSEKLLDLNNDGIIDIDDGRLLRRFYGFRPTYVGWDERLDYNNDGAIDIDDRRLLKKNYGRKVNQ